MISGGVDRFINTDELVENNFNYTPPDVEIWRGDIPYKPGDLFPTEAIQKRANGYLTNQRLYQNRFEGILDSAFSWTDYMINPITNFPNLAICADLPDWYTTTEAWVSIFSRPPELDTALDINDDAFNKTSGKLRTLSSILNNSNFAEVWSDIIRSAQIVYGNKAVRVTKLEGGGVHIDNLPLKCWQPFVNANNTSIVECNLFFNIYNDTLTHKDKCEFIAYVEDGKIIKKVFEYEKGRLGRQLGEPEYGEAFEGKYKLSPVVVFKGTSLGGGIYGESQYKYWDASIASAIRNYEAIGVLVEQAKEIIRLIPAGATKTDDYTGITYQNRTGAIAYSDLENPPIVKLEKIQIQLDQVIQAYKESIARLARDTGLPASFFDTRELNIASSGVALKTSMYRTELLSNVISSNMLLSLKQLIKKIAVLYNLDIEDSIYNIVINNSIVVDEKQKADIIQARIQGKSTMSIAQAIKEYEGVSIDIAMKKAAELEGVNLDENIDDRVTIDSGTGSNQTTDNIEFTASNNTEDFTPPLLEYPIGVTPV